MPEATVWHQQRGSATEPAPYRRSVRQNLVGAYLDDVGVNNAQGSAYVFARSGSTWTQQARLNAAGGAANDWFGFSVALEGAGGTALVGALTDVGANANQGSAWVFDLTPCRADMNADGELTFDDIALFVGFYNAADSRADFNSDGEWTFDDVTLFVGAFNAGC
jgi:hypothetical protein